MTGEASSLLRDLGCRGLTFWLDADAAGQAGLLGAAETASGGQNPGLAVHVVDPEALARLLGDQARQGDPNGLLQLRGRRGVLEALAVRLPIRLFAALEDSNRFGPIEQVLVESDAGPEDLDHLLKNGRDLPDLAREIATERDREVRELERVLVWAHGLNRARAGAARISAYLHRELAALQKSSPA